MTRFLSRAPGDRRDALEKLWDAFEMVKHIESGGQTQGVKQSVTRLLDRAALGPLRAELEAELNSLNKIGNNFSIRHHGGQQQTLPTELRSITFSSALRALSPSSCVRPAA